MLFTQKHTSLHSITFGFPKNPVLFTNPTSNEVYIQIQPFKNQYTGTDLTNITTELTNAGFVINTPIYTSGLSLNLAANSEYKVLVQQYNGDTQVAIYYSASIGSPINL